MGKKFTFYSDKTDVLQSDHLTALHESQSLQDLMKDNTFWLDICKPSQADLNVIAEVNCFIGCRYLTSPFFSLGFPCSPFDY